MSSKQKVTQPKVEESTGILLSELATMTVGRRRFDYKEVKAWILDQANNGIAPAVTVVEKKFGLRYLTLVWRARQNGDHIQAVTVEKNGAKTKYFMMKENAFPVPVKKSKKQKPQVTQ